MSGFDSQNITLVNEDGEERKIGELSGVELETSNEKVDTSRGGLGEVEVSFEIDIEIDKQTIQCPHCNHNNELPDSELVHYVHREPYPCNWCGYPLL